MDPGQIPAGTRLKDRYEIRAEIGRGGFSVVYEAQDLETGKAVAIKMHLPPPAVAVQARERLRREVLAVQALSHPNVISIYDLVDDGPWTWVVMEHIAGVDLQIHVARNGPMSAGEVTRLAQEMTDALSLAHAQGILHRDVKPKNVLVDATGRAVLTDFGSARISGQETITRTGAIVGTLDYTAPEILQGGRGDARSDLYSLGMTLFFAYAGELPARTSPLLPPPDRAEGHSPASLRKDSEEGISGLIRWCTAADPRNRPMTAGMLATALRQPTAPTPSLPLTTGTTCLSCKAPDPFGAALCQACASGAPDRGSVFVRVSPPVTEAARRELESRLGTIVPSLAGTTTLGDVIVGVRPLYRLDPSSGARVTQALSRLGITAFVAPTRLAWKAFPGRLGVILLTMGAAGLAVGESLHVSVGWLSLALAGGLGVLATRIVSQAAVTPIRSTADAPAGVRQALQALTTLGPGTAHDLLSDALQISCAIGKAMEKNGGPDRIPSEFNETLLAASGAALELAVLDQTLTSMTLRQKTFTRLPEEWVASVARCEESRDRLVQGLLEAIASLGGVLSTDPRLEGGHRDRLKESAAALRKETEQRISAAQEVHNLVHSAAL